MSADALISRLDGVKQTGSGRWIARCPAHEDKNPSMTVRELDDGRVLIHDFAGCSPEEILASVGMTFSDLFPEKPLDHRLPRERRPFSAIDALRCIAVEATLASVAASNVAGGIPMSEEERLRLHTAAGRINHALEVALS